MRWVITQLLTSLVLFSTALGQEDKPKVPDAISVELETAKKGYRATIEDAHTKLLRACLEEKERALENPKLRIEQKIKISDDLDAQQARFEKDGSLPNTPALKTAVREFEASNAKA